MMDNCCAPQWTDFTRSPQVASDSYFEVEHEVHEPLTYLKSTIKPDISPPFTKQNIEEASVTQTDFDDSLENQQNIVTNTAFFLPYDPKKQSIENTNKNNDLRRAMTDLSFDEKSTVIQHAWKVSLGDLATVSNKPKRTAPERMKKSVHISETKNISGKSSKNKQAINNVIKLEGALTKQTSKPLVKLEVDDYPKHAEVNFPERRVSFKVHRRQSDVFKRRRSLSKSQPKVLVCQYRRRSLTKYRRCSNQFVSMAEAVSKFQNGTPQRFRTMSNKDLKPGPLMKLKRSVLKLTHPVSPALRCKQRARHTTVLSQQEREALELEERKKHQIKAKPVPVNILKAPAVLKKVPKKPVTVTEEFHLTRSKSTRHTTSLLVATSSSVSNKEQNQKTALSLIRSASASNIINKKGEKCSELLTENNAKCMKEATPFNFEARNKEFQQKKEEKLKNLQIQETGKLKAEFHARPVPKFLKPLNPVKENNAKKRTVVPCPFSFAERDKNLAKKKEELVKQLQEQDKKTRVFHANPVPTFKSVPIHHSSKEKTVSNSKDPVTRQVRSCYDQENKQPNIMLVDTMHADEKEEVKEHRLNKKQFKGIANDKNVKVKVEQNSRKSVKPKLELNTDKRAKVRNEFEEKIRKKEQEQEAKRLEEERNKLAKEKLERAKLRKLTEVKANPMPVYKPMVILKSSKPPTSPRSPLCINKNRMKNVS